MTRGLVTSLLTSAVFALTASTLFSSSSDSPLPVASQLSAALLVWLGLNVGPALSRGAWQDESIAHTAIDLGWVGLQYVIVILVFHFVAIAL